MIDWVGRKDFIYTDPHFQVWQYPAPTNFSSSVEKIEIENTLIFRQTRIRTTKGKVN